MNTPIIIPLQTNIDLKFGEMVDVYFSDSGTYSDTDPYAFNPPLQGHFTFGQSSRNHQVVNTVLNDVYTFESDSGAMTMGTVHVTNHGLGGEDLGRVKDVVGSARDLIAFAVDTLKNNATEMADDRSRFFFPGGINSISVSVTAGTIGVQVAISGPATSSGSGLAGPKDQA
jgi:hypothetical protein